jgi:hypothetical protein
LGNTGYIIYRAFLGWGWVHGKFLGAPFRGNFIQGGLGEFRHDLKKWLEIKKIIFFITESKEQH